ncbi:MAG: T9SS type A sorting domain-containing protein [Flavobacteriales bacterium]
MKHKLLLFGAMIYSASLLAQSVDPANYQRIETEPRKTNDAAIPGAKQPINISNRGGGDLIWSEPFNGASSFSDWTKTDNTTPACGFVWSTTGPTGPFSDPDFEKIESTTASNGFIIIRTDAANDDGNGGSNGNAITASCSDTINLGGGIDGIYVTLEHNFRYFIPQTVRDNGLPYGLYFIARNPAGDTLVTYNMIGSVSVNNGSPNPVTGTKYYIPTAGLNYVNIGFYHLNLSNYYWAIDDIKAYEAYDNDLTMEDVYLNGYDIDSIEVISQLSSPIYLNKYYDEIPTNQAASMTMDMIMVYSNSGNDAPTSTTGNFGVTGPSSINFTNSNNSATPPASAEYDSLMASAQFVGSSSVAGNYTASFQVTSASEQDNSDNSKQIKFSSSTNRYKWDQLEPSRIRRLETDDMLAVAFEAYTNDSLIGVELGIFDPAAPSPQSDGSVISVYLYEFDDIIDNLDSRINDGVQNGNAASPIATLVDFHELGAADIDVEKTYALKDPIALTAGKSYVVGLKNQQGEAVWIVFDQGVDPAPWSIFTNSTTSQGTGVGGTWFTEQIVPMIRIITKNADACASTNFVITGDITNNLEEFSVDLNLDVNGGTGDLYYFWTNPDGEVFSNEEDLEGITDSGTYTVKVIDQNGCSGTASFSLTGNIGIDEAISKSVSIYPNPAKSSVNLSFGNAGTFNIEMTNVQGQTVYFNKSQVSEGGVKTISTESFARGLYFIKVSNDTKVEVSEIVLD